MKKYYLTANIIQRTAWLPLRLIFRLFTGLEVRGLDRLKKLNTNFIVASNHINELDPLIIVACLPFWSKKLPLIFVSREKAFYSTLGWQKHLYGGFFFKLMGAFQAYTGLNNYKKALVHHLEALTEAKNVCIFPLGRRHTDGDLHQAKGGVVFLSVKTGLPVLPVRISGIGAMSAKDFFYRKRRMQVTFGEPLYLKGIVPANGTVAEARNEYEVTAVRLMEGIAGLDTASA